MLYNPCVVTCEFFSLLEVEAFILHARFDQDIKIRIKKCFHLSVSV